MPVLLRHTSLSAPAAVWNTTARTAVSIPLAWTAYAQTQVPDGLITWDTWATTDPLGSVAIWSAHACTDGQAAPVEVRRSGPWLEHEQRVTLVGLNATVLDWSYSHSGPTEELSVRVTGRHGLALPTVTLGVNTFQCNLGDRRLFQRLPPRQFVRLGAEPEVSVRDNTTTFLWRNSFEQALRGERLPELIRWKLHPSPVPTGRACLRIQQRQSVSALVHQVMRERVDPSFRMDDDPLAGEEWIEGERDYTTEGLTPQGLWDATYGLLGMVLWVMPRGAGLSLVGTWSQPYRLALSTPPADRWVLDQVERRERWQTPSTLTVKGAPQATEKTTTALLGWLGQDHPAYAEVEAELAPDREWYDQPVSAGTGVVWRGYRKEGGRITETVEVAAADMTVTETVDGEVRIYPWPGVGVGYKYSKTVYDPECSDRILRQRLESKSWGFDAATQGGGFQATGPGVYLNLTVGDLTADETTDITYVHSPQGYTSARTSTTRKLASLKQQGAESDVAERGPLQGREYITTVTTERWQPTGGGKWWYDSGTSAQALLPVYDAESGEAVRTASVVRAGPTGPQFTDQGPDTWACPSPCAPDVLDEAGVILTVGDAGFGEPREVTVPMLSPGRLGVVAQAIITDSWHRIVTTYTLGYPVAAVPGQEFGGGVVRGVRISGSATNVETEVTVAALDVLLGAPGGSLSGMLADPQRGRAIMLARAPNGAVARVLKGWNPGTNQAVWERAFIAFRTGMPPAPGDEIEWELRRGQREAVRANR